MGYLDGWIYQKSHTITGSAAGARTNYPTGIKVYYGSGTDGDEVVGGATFGKIYCDSKCRTDFGDIRFTKSDGASLLDYWIEEQIDGDYAIIWVEVDSIPASPGTVDIYIFYGNAGATTTSNGDDTWLIFNDCETTTGWSEQYVVGSPYWGPATLDGVQTIRIEANAHNEKLRIQYDTIICTGREGRRHLTRVKHTSWNADGYFYWYAPLALSPSTQYDALRYSSYFDYYTLYASVGGVSDTTNYSVAHPIGWYRYEKKTNAAGEVTAYRDATNLGTATVDGDYSGGKVMYYVNEWNSGLTRHYIDWFAVGKYVDPEPTHTAWGPEVSEVSRDLKAIFHVKQDSVDLKAEFTLRQLTNDLHASFWIRLPGIPADLFAKFETNLHHGIPADLYCKLHIRRIYDLSDSGGLGFFWEGVGRGHVDIEIFTPTGAWTGKFPDWGVMTWVPLKWEDLTEVDIDGSRPDKSQITGILWTYHSDGIRHVDWIVGLPKGGDRDIFSKFIVRHSSYADLKGEFHYNHFRSDLKARFIILGEQPGRGPVASQRFDVGNCGSYYWSSGWDTYPLVPPQGRKCFKGLGRWWIFYAEGEISTTRDLVFKSMPVGGNTFSAKTTAGQYLYGGLTTDWDGRFAIHWDGTYVHLAYQSTDHGSIRYKRGQPQSDGTIPWGTEYVAKAAIGTDLLAMSITVDASGHPFIAYRANASSGDAKVINSSTNDGTWVTDQDFVISSTDDNWFLTALALENGNVIIIAAAGGQDIREAVWDGAAWTVTVFDPFDNIHFNAGAKGNDVHLVYYEAGAVYYMKRTWGVGWSSPEFAFTVTDTFIPAVSMGEGWENQGEIAVGYYEGAIPKIRRRLSTGIWTDAVEGKEAPKAIYDWNLNMPLTYSGGQMMIFYSVEDYPSTYNGRVYACKIRCFNAPEIKAEFTLRQLTNDLKGVFLLRQGTEDLKAEFIVRHSASRDLFVKFETYPAVNLKATFHVGQGSKNLFAKFEVI